MQNKFSEVAMLVLAALLIVAGSVLLYVGKITYESAIFFFVSALGLFGFNSAFKAPSPAQQAMLDAQQKAMAGVQELALNTANALAAHSHPAPEPVVLAPVQPIIAPALNLPTDRHFGDSMVIQAVKP